VAIQHNTGSSNGQLLNTPQQFTFCSFSEFSVIHTSRNIRTVCKQFVILTVELLAVVFTL